MEKEFDVISRSFFLAHTHYPISNTQYPKKFAHLQIFYYLCAINVQYCIN